MLRLRGRYGCGRTGSHLALDQSQTRIYVFNDRLTFDELGNLLANIWNALRVGVCSDGSYLVVQLLRARDGVLWEYILAQLHQWRIFRQRRNLEVRPCPVSGPGYFGLGNAKYETYLSAKSQRRLIETLLLGISDVSIDHSIEGQAVVVGVFTEHVAILFRLDRELPTDRILDLDEMRVDVGDRERVQGRVGFRGHCSKRGEGRVQNRRRREESSSHSKRPETSVWIA